VIVGLDAWRDLPAAQQPVWPDAEALATAVRTLSSYPPLVFAGECDVLKGRLADAAAGKAFVLQGGDCAETFASATADNIRDRIKTILQMAAILTYGASMPVIKVGRIAGQFAKPRSSNDETRGGVTTRARRPSTWSGRSPPAASPTCATCTTGTGVSSLTRPTRGTRASRWTSTRR